MDWEEIARNQVPKERSNFVFRWLTYESALIAGGCFALGCATTCLALGSFRSRNHDVHLVPKDTADQVGNDLGYADASLSSCHKDSDSACELSKPAVETPDDVLASDSTSHRSSQSGCEAAASSLVQGNDLSACSSLSTLPTSHPLQAVFQHPAYVQALQRCLYSGSRASASNADLLLDIIMSSPESWTYSDAAFILHFRNLVQFVHVLNANSQVDTALNYLDNLHAEVKRQISFQMSSQQHHFRVRREASESGAEWSKRIHVRALLPCTLPYIPSSCFRRRWNSNLLLARISSRDLLCLKLSQYRWFSAQANVQLSYRILILEFIVLFTWFLQGYLARVWHASMQRIPSLAAACGSFYYLPACFSAVIKLTIFWGAS
jgi:hypothetical protein